MTAHESLLTKSPDKTVGHFTVRNQLHNAPQRITQKYKHKNKLYDYHN